jgi:hypothetical protein
MGLTHNILGAASSGARLAALLVYPGYFSRDCGVVLFVLGCTLALKPNGRPGQQTGEHLTHQKRGNLPFESNQVQYVFLRVVKSFIVSPEAWGMGFCCKQVSFC